MSNKNSLKIWLYDNSWHLMAVFIGCIIVFTTLKLQVEGNTKTIYALQQRVDKYPSEQWFAERFKNIDTNQIRMEKIIDEVKTALEK